MKVHWDASGKGEATVRISARWGSEKQRISVSKGTLVGHSRIRVFIEGPKAGDITGVCNVNSGVGM